MSQKLPTQEPIVIVSGGFDPIHAGHVKMLKEASSWGRVVIALNSDGWLIRKKGFVFMPYFQRAELLRAMGYGVGSVDDSDGTVCNAIESIAGSHDELRRHGRIFFANGGDRIMDNTPEVGLCKRLGIRLLFGMGGEKEGSSSSLCGLESKPWGSQRTLQEGADWKVRLLTVNPDARLSLQSHTSRSEHWTCLSGRGSAYMADFRKTLYPGQQAYIPQGIHHRLVNDGLIPLVVLELQRGSCDDSDITRYEDEYGRIQQ